MKYQIHIKDVKAPSVPTSRGTTAGRLVFASGQIAVDENDDTRLIEGGFSEQVNHVLDLIERVLDEVDCSLTDVAQATVYLTDLANMPALDEIWEERFVRPMPTRSVVGVNALPLGALVQMDVIACR